MPNNRVSKRGRRKTSSKKLAVDTGGDEKPCSGRPVDASLGLSALTRSPAPYATGAAIYVSCVLGFVWNSLAEGHAVIWSEALLGALFVFPFVMYGCWLFIFLDKDLNKVYRSWERWLSRSLASRFFSPDMQAPEIPDRTSND